MPHHSQNLSSSSLQECVNWQSAWREGRARLTEENIHHHPPDLLRCERVASKHGEGRQKALPLVSSGTRL